MCLASAGRAGLEVCVGIGCADQRSSGTITLPRPSEVRCGGRGRRGDIEGVHRIDEIADLIYEVLDPPLIKVAYHDRIPFWFMARPAGRRILYGIRIRTAHWIRTVRPSWDSITEPSWPLEAMPRSWHPSILKITIHGIQIPESSRPLRCNGVRYPT